MIRTRLLLVTALLGTAASAADWPRFRGPNGAGVGGSAVPLEWSAEKNLRWRTPLPGPGSSSPIVQGDRVFVTCYSGYGTAAGGEPAQLVRHLVCLDRATGKPARLEEPGQQAVGETWVIDVGVARHEHDVHLVPAAGEHFRSRGGQRCRRRDWRRIPVPGARCGIGTERKRHGWSSAADERGVAVV